ncbi:MAG: GNAT family N-acetyltransferase [Trueperaceae bacterium]
MSPYSLHRFGDLDAFAEAAEPFLLEDEAAHSLLLGLIGGIRAGEWKNPYLAIVERESGLRGAAPALVALRTPPHKLLLSRCDDLEALQPLLADAGLARGLTGVLGPATVADAFAVGWIRSTSIPVRPGQRQRIYRLDRVSPVADVPGVVRRADESDRPILSTWMSGFLAEALPGKPTDVSETVDRWLGSPQRQLYFWDVDGHPVSMAGVGSPTPRGVRVSAVYTPPEKRRQGFAGTLVAELSRRQLAAGREFCCLFTDLANPTSNRVYRQLGYRPVCDASEYLFGGTG